MENINPNNQAVDIQRIENIVQKDGDNVFTTSLIVAEAFEKEHKNVLQSIENLECSEKFNQLNFQPVKYKDAKGEMRPAYHITRDGFAFLAMGFTGKKAAAWKEKFIEAFNAMEKALMMPKPVFGFEFPKIEPGRTRDERSARLIRGYCAYWALVDKLPLPVAEHSVCAHLGIKSLNSMTVEKFTDAMNYLTVVCFQPTLGHFETDPLKAKIILLGHILSAANQFKYLNKEDLREDFESISGISLEDITTLTEHDLDKMLFTASSLLHRAKQAAQMFAMHEEDSEGEE